MKVLREYKIPQPGEKKFIFKVDAIEFARQRVVEYWVVHLRPCKEGWIVVWWCQ